MMNMLEDRAKKSGKSVEEVKNSYIRDSEITWLTNDKWIYDSC